MATKLAKDTYPRKLLLLDFQCSGPPATKMAIFDKRKDLRSRLLYPGRQRYETSTITALSCNIAKAKVVRLFMSGGYGAANPSFQFVECANEQDAQRAFFRNCIARMTLVANGSRSQVFVHCGLAQVKIVTWSARWRREVLVCRRSEYQDQ